VVFLLVAASLLAGRRIGFGCRTALTPLGATFIVIAYAEDEQVLEEGMQAAFRRSGPFLDSMLSNYRPGSEWSKVNREAAQKPVQVSPELFRLLEYCGSRGKTAGVKGTIDLSVGPFDAGMGILPGQWTPTVPGGGSSAEQKVGFGAVELIDREPDCAIPEARR